MFTRQIYDNCYNNLSCKSRKDYEQHQYRIGDTCQKNYSGDQAVAESDLLGITNKGNRNCNLNKINNIKNDSYCKNINSLSTRSILNDPNRGFSMFNNPTEYGVRNNVSCGHNNKSNFVSLFPNVLPTNNFTDNINVGNYSFPKCASIVNNPNLDTSRCIYNKYNDATRIMGKSSRLDSKNKFGDLVKEYSKITAPSHIGNVHPTYANVSSNGNFNC